MKYQENIDISEKVTNVQQLIFFLALGRQYTIFNIIQKQHVGDGEGWCIGPCDLQDVHLSRWQEKLRIKNSLCKTWLADIKEETEDKKKFF